METKTVNIRNLKNEFLFGGAVRFETYIAKVEELDPQAVPTATRLWNDGGCKFFPEYAHTLTIQISQ